MKCPKCGYLGFDQVDRCRNCGYDFSLASDPPVPELALRTHTSDEALPLDDLMTFLKEAETPRVTPSGDLPLFRPPVGEDEPLITKASPPRPPLAVRRATPEVPRVRGASRSQTLDFAFEAEPASKAPERPRIARFGNSSSSEIRPSLALEATDDASLSARFVALTLDVLILGAVDAVIVYLTMQFCGLTLGELRVLPKVPLLAFLLLQNSGYLVAFTVGGQTLGKMAVGIRVVAADAAEPLDLGRSVQRTLLWLVLAIPAGLGFLTALLTHDHRGLHDRLAGTRVVRAPA